MDKLPSHDQWSEAPYLKVVLVLQPKEGKTKMDTKSKNKNEEVWNKDDIVVKQVRIYRGFGILTQGERVDMLSTDDANLLNSWPSKFLAIAHQWVDEGNLTLPPGMERVPAPPEVERPRRNPEMARSPEMERPHGIPSSDGGLLLERLSADPLSSTGHQPARNPTGDQGPTGQIRSNVSAPRPAPHPHSDMSSLRRRHQGDWGVTGIDHIAAPAAGAVGLGVDTGGWGITGTDREAGPRRAGAAPAAPGAGDDWGEVSRLARDEGESAEPVHRPPDPGGHPQAAAPYLQNLASIQRRTSPSKLDS